MTILSELFQMQDKEYALFQSRLTPNVPKEQFIGVRVPDVRKLAKRYSGTEEAARFMQCLPHDYYDENMLHGLMISEIRDYDECIRLTDAFLPYVDNWAVCDIMSPKVFGKHKTELMGKIKEWSSSQLTYTCRFGIEMLMSHYLDDDFEPGLQDIPAGVHSDEYYVNMMIAWFFAAALAKQWNDTIGYLERGRLDLPVHNKTIQKACESRRISDGQKKYLKSLKR